MTWSGHQQAYIAGFIPLRPGFKKWGRSAEWICVAGRAVWVFLKRSFLQLVKCKSTCSLVNRRHFFL